jgi:hypothetical protein
MKRVFVKGTLGAYLASGVDKSIAGDFAVLLGLVV